MKCNQFSKKEQEIRNNLIAEAFCSFCGIGLHTSVVHTTPPTVIDIMGSKTRKKVLLDSYTSHIV